MEFKRYKEIADSIDYLIVDSSDWQNDIISAIGSQKNIIITRYNGKGYDATHNVYEEGSSVEVKIRLEEGNINNEGFSIVRVVD